MVRREVRGKVEDRGVRGPLRRSIGHRAHRTPRSSTYPLDTGIRPESNRRSGGPGEVPAGEVSAPLGNPGYSTSSPPAGSTQDSLGFGSTTSSTSIFTRAQVCSSSGKSLASGLLPA